MRYPPTSKQYTLRWAGLISIDGETFEFMGDSARDDEISSLHTANQTSFEYTATRSTFKFEARGVPFSVSFLSPVTPHDYVRASLPLSYMTVEVDSSALKNHDISVYSDIAGDWATGDSDAELVSAGLVDPIDSSLTRCTTPGMGLCCACRCRCTRHSTQAGTRVCRIRSASRVGQRHLCLWNGKHLTKVTKSSV